MRKLTPKHLLIALVFIAPFLLLIWFTIFSATDSTFSLPLFHFYIVTFTTFSAAVISILLSVTLQEIAQPRHYLAAVAFAIMGALFFTHGLATPGALMAAVHPAISWSAWLTLFSGGAIFTLAALAGLDKLPSFLSVRRVTQWSVGLVTLYFVVVFFVPNLFDQLNLYSNPWHRWVIFVVSLSLWLFAAYQFARLWWTTLSRVDGVLAFVAVWMGAATISMHQFPTWNISWWLYHFILLGGFLVTVYFLLAEYEQARQFSLLRYYLVTSLIMIALIAMVISYLFAEFSYHNLLAEKQAAAATTITVMTAEAAKTMPPGTTLDQALALYADILPRYSPGSVTVYNNQDVAVKPAPNPASSTGSASEFGYDSSYEPPAHNHTTVETEGAVVTQTPLFLNPTEPAIGYAVSTILAQDISQTILQARMAGLVITALSMSVLFGILLLVVARADQIITARNEELALAYKNLQEAEGMRDDLTNMIIHDLRNPLTTIYGTLGLVQSFNGQEQPEIYTYYIRQALRASERMTGLIDDILAVSKIEAGQIEPTIKPTIVCQLLAERLDSFASRAREEHKRLSLDCPDDIEAHLDAKMIGRVIENLLGNALKYTEKGGQIQLSAWVEQDQLVVSVCDDGEGISDEHKQRIFGKFAQAPNANDRPGRKGTGLGLAFCSHAVQQHGGHIWVEDAPGGGSKFIFRLPLAQAVVANIA